MATDDSMVTEIEPDDARTLEFEAIRETAAGAKLRLTCSHWLQFDEMPAQLSADENASRANVVVILPQYNGNDIEPAGARFECSDFLTFRDLRAFHRWLRNTFSRLYEHYTTDCVETEFFLAGTNRSLELQFRSGTVRKKCKMSVIGRVAEPPLQRDEWSAHWKWATETAFHEYAFTSDFSFFFDQECLRLAAFQLGEYLRVYGPIEE